MNPRTFIIYRGDNQQGGYKTYTTDVSPGMVVLDAVHKIQEELEPDLAVRWNCKAGKCGSCGAEINGVPRLMCMTRLSSLPEGQPTRISPMKAFPIIKDLVNDVSWNYEQNKKIKPFTPDPHTDWKMQQEDVERVQEFRKCIECFLCQNVCHVLRTHGKHEEFMGPRYFVRAASLDMHPLDTENRVEHLQKEGGLGLCNVTKCCTAVCPENIAITDNAIIPLKERAVDRLYDPLHRLWRWIGGIRKSAER